LTEKQTGFLSGSNSVQTIYACNSNYLNRPIIAELFGCGHTPRKLPAFFKEKYIAAISRFIAFLPVRAQLPQQALR